MGVRTIPVMRPTAPPMGVVSRHLESVHASGWFSNFGPQEQRLRGRFAERFAVSPDRVVPVANATLALAGVVGTSRARVWEVPSFTFVATPAAVRLAGARLHFGDVEARGWWLSSDAHGAAQGKVVVAPFGAAPDPSVATDDDEEVVVDAAASMGSTGILSHLPPGWCVVLSLHATKVLGAGEGAIAVFGDPERALAFRAWTNFGFRGSRESRTPGINAKMSEVQAAYVHAALDGWEQERTEWIAARDRVLEVGDDVGLTTFRTSREQITPYWIAVLPDATTTDLVEEVLEEHGIGTRRWWSRGCHRMPAYADVPHGPLPVTDDVANRYLGLPLYRGLSAEDADRIRTALLDARQRADVW